MQRPPILVWCAAAALLIALTLGFAFLSAPDPSKSVCADQSACAPDHTCSACPQADGHDGHHADHEDNVCPCDDPHHGHAHDAVEPQTAAALAASLKPLTKKPGETVRLVASFYPMYIAARHIVKDIPNVSLVNLTRPQTGCLHNHEITVADMRTLATADVLIVNGAGAEGFLAKVLSDMPTLRIVDASAAIEPIRTEGGVNPHVWVSPSLHIEQVNAIAGALATVDSARAEAYARNAAAYVAQLEVLRREMHAGLAHAGTHDIVTFHEAFPYFAREFGLHVAAVVEREPGVEPGAREIAATITLVREKSIKALFAEPQYASRAAELIAQETGTRVYTLDPAVTGPMEDGAYLAAMRRNLAVLREALGTE